MRLDHTEGLEATGARLRDRALAAWIGMLLMGLLGLSISIRTQQARRILKGPGQVTTMTKSGLPDSPLPDFEPIRQVFASRMSSHQPRPSLVMARAIGSKASFTQILRHSVTAQHRPPPDFPA